MGVRAAPTHPVIDRPGDAAPRACAESVGQGGQIANVCRVFNDRIGVEIVERTGKNPQYEYIQLGCSKRAEQRMLHYARTKCLGRPFSNMGMARSILWPRQTDNSSFFCAGTCTAAPDSL